MADSQRVGGVYYDVDMNTSRLIDGERRATASMDKIGFKATTVADAVQKAFAAITLGAFLSKLVEVQRQFDILNAGLITATGSTQEAAKAFEVLQKFAATTPYSIDQAVTAFTRLTNLGLDPSIKSLTAYGNTAAAMGKDLMQMIEAVADASTGEFERLKEFGIRASKQGDNVSLTFKGVTETVKFSSENIQKYLMNLAETNFDGAMAERAQTLDGAISNLGDSWDQLFLTISQSGIGENIADMARVGSSALDVIGRTIENVDGDSEQIRKNDHLKRWADSTVNAMANIADAAEKVWQTVTVLGRNVAFVFDSIGTEIGARAAQAKAFLSGDFEAAGDMGNRLAAESAKRRAALDKADNDTLKSRKSWGDRMREEWAKGVMPLDPNALGGKGGKGGRGGGGGSPGASKQKFDSQGYINDLVIANADGLAKIDAQEKDALDKAKKLREEEKISKQQYEQAVTLIRLAASKDREELIKKQADEEKEKIKERIAAEEYAADATKSLAQQELDSFDSAYNQRLEKLKELHEKGLISEQAYADAVANINKQKEENKTLQMQKVVDPIAALEIEQAKKLELFDSYAAQLLEKEISSETAIQQARTALVADHEAQRQALAEQTFRSQSEANAFLMDSLDSLSSTATSAIGGLIDGTMTGKEAMIALGRTIRDQAIQALVEMGIQYVKNLIISKTVGTATTTLAATQAGIVATAWAPAAALSSLATLGTNAVAAQAGILATTGIAKMAAVAGGRQYGGAVAADSLYRVNENGAPEMFTASNGRQYMMPNTRGEVTPANKLGGGVTINIVNTMADATVTATSSDSGTVDITVQRAVAEVASQIASNSGQVWSAMKGATNVQSKL